MRKLILAIISLPLLIGVVWLYSSCSKEPLSPSGAVPDPLNKSTPSTGSVVGSGSIVNSDGSFSRNIPPMPPPENYKAHLFYVGSLYEGTVKVFSAEDRRFIDSLYFPTDSRGVGVAVVGANEKLIVTTAYGVSLYDLRTKTTSYPLGDAKYASISPDCKFIALGRKWSDPYSYRLELRRYPGMQFIYGDSLSTWVSFSKDSRYIAYIHNIQDPPLTSELMMYDIIGNKVIENSRKYYGEYDVYIADAEYCSKEGKTFMTGIVGSMNIVCVSDVGDSSVRVLHLDPYYVFGGITLSPDEDFLFVTKPESWMGYPSEKVYVYDVASESLIKVILTSQYNHEPGRLAVTFDNKYILTCSFGSLNWPNVCLIDGSTLDPIGSYDYVGAPGSPIYPAGSATRTWHK